MNAIQEIERLLELREKPFSRGWSDRQWAAAAASANATEALRKLLAVCNEVNNVHGLIKDNPMFRRLIEAFDALQAAKEAK